jgi:hypothetical protein
MATPVYVYELNAVEVMAQKLIRINNERGSIKRVLEQFLNDIASNLNHIKKQIVKKFAIQKCKFSCKKCPRKFNFLSGLVAQ